MKSLKKVIKQSSNVIGLFFFSFNLIICWLGNFYSLKIAENAAKKNFLKNVVNDHQMKLDCFHQLNLIASENFDSWTNAGIPPQESNKTIMKWNWIVFINLIWFIKNILFMNNCMYCNSKEILKRVKIWAWNEIGLFS